MHEKGSLRICPSEVSEVRTAQGSPSSILRSLNEIEAVFSKAQGGRASWKVLDVGDQIPRPCRRYQVPGTRYQEGTDAP